MSIRALRFAFSISILGVFVMCQLGAKNSMEDDKIADLIADGKYTEAEKLLQSRIADPNVPITTEPAAIQLEVLRRTRQDFALTNDQVLAEIKKTVPDATRQDVDLWRKSGDLQ